MAIAKENQVQENIKMCWSRQLHVHCINNRINSTKTKNIPNSRLPVGTTTKMKTNIPQNIHNALVMYKHMLQQKRAVKAVKTLRTLIVAAGLYNNQLSSRPQPINKSPLWSVKTPHHYSYMHTSRSCQTFVARSSLQIGNIGDITEVGHLATKANGIHTKYSKVKGNNSQKKE